MSINHEQKNLFYLSALKDDRLLKHFRFIIDSFTDCKISKALFFQNFVFCSSFSNCLSCDRGVLDEMIYAARQTTELANLTGRCFTTPVSPNYILL